LAFIYLELGRVSEALPLFKKVYSLQKEVLGKKHPDTLVSLKNWASIYVTSLVQADTQQEQLELADIYSGLVVQFNQQGLFKQALPFAEKAFRIRKDSLGEEHPDTLISFSNFASIYSQLGHFSEALPLFEKVYSLSKKVLGEKHPDTLASLDNLAYIYLKLGRISEALPLSEKAYSLFKEVLGEKHSDTLVSLNNWVSIYLKLGRFSKALPLSEKAYSLSNELLGEKHPYTLGSLNNLASIYLELGHFSEALPLFEKVYSLSKKVLGEKHPYTLISLNNCASIYEELGRFSQALLLYEKAYFLSDKMLGEKHPDTLTSLNNLASIYLKLGKFSQALSLSKKAYFLIREVLGKHPDILHNIINNLAVIYLKSGQFSQALPLFEKAYFFRKEVLGEKHPYTLHSINNLASIYFKLGSFSQALPLLEKSYSLRKNVLGEKHPDTLISLNNLAVLAMQENPQKSIQLFEKFVLGVEKLRPSDLSANNRQAFFKQWIHGYFSLSSLYIDQSRPQDAFRLAEMSKSRTLLESLSTKLAAQQSGVTADEQQQLQDNEARLAFLSNRIAKALENNRLEKQIELEAEKNQLVNQFNQFHSDLMAKYPKYAQLSEVKIMGAKEGAKYLPADAVLINYLVHKNEVLAFTLQADGTLTAHNLGEISKLEELIKDYRDQLPVQIKEEQGSESTGSPELILFDPKPKKKLSPSLQLGQKLLEPLYDVIKDKPHWIISPSGPLALIPFETLRVDGDKQPPVIAKHQISYVQSLSVLALLQERGEVYNSLSNRGQLLAMGAPLYKNSSAGTTKSHPSTIDFKIAGIMVERGSNYAGAFGQLGRDDWNTLPGALAELEQLETLFKDSKPLIYKQADATEAKLQALNKQGILAQYRYLVFSAHGYLSPQMSALSAIVLGQVNNPPGIDGYVTAGEWPGYDLKSDLMVLSACETGLGEVVSGEGVMGLPYAFYVAGNKNTILTLWEISDDVTVEFITRFFAKLKAGKGKVGEIEALTATKREFLEKGGHHSNPKYWAAFVLYGV